MQFTIEGGSLTRLLTYLALAAPLRKGGASRHAEGPRTILRAKADGRLELQRTGMGTQGRVTAPAGIMETGEAGIDADALIAVLKGVGSKEAIGLRRTEKTLIFNTKTGVYRLPVLDDPMAEIETKTKRAEFTLPGALLAAEIDRVARAAATFEPYDVIHMEIQGRNGNGARRGADMVATDGHRLFRSHLDLQEVEAGKDENEAPLTVNLPLETARAWSKLAAGFDVPGRLTLYDETADLAGGMPGGVEVLSRSATAATKFPAWREILPKTSVTTLCAEKNHLVQALRGLAVLSTPLAHGVRFDFQEDQVALSLRSPDLGEGAMSVAGSIDGEKQSPSFNVDYLLDAVGGIEDGGVTLKFSGEETPLLIESGTHPYIAVVMPIRL